MCTSHRGPAVPSVERERPAGPLRVGACRGRRPPEKLDPTSARATAQRTCVRPGLRSGLPWPAPPGIPTVPIVSSTISTASALRYGAASRHAVAPHAPPRGSESASSELSSSLSFKLLGTKGPRQRPHAYGSPHFQLPGFPRGQHPLQLEALAGLPCLRGRAQSSAPRGGRAPGDPDIHDQLAPRQSLEL